MAHSSAHPAVRDILGAFVLPDTEGRNIDLEQFRQRYNLVILFLKKVLPTSESLLRQLAGAAEALSSEDAVAVAVFRGSPTEASLIKKRLRLQFPVVADETGETVDSFCPSETAIYITDRFREIFALRHGSELFSRDEILEWLAHINRQCPE